MPAAAVIPAPIAYIKVVAVKKLVVGFVVRVEMVDKVDRFHSTFFVLALGWHSVAASNTRIFYCEKIRVFKAGVGHF